MVTLRAGELEAVFVPDAGMVCSSLTHRGQQLLHIGGGVERYRERGSTFGVPLLAPWANRIDADVDEAAPVKRDENGLPIHGLLTASALWEVADVESDSVEARLPFGAPDLLAGFPYPHELTIRAALSARALTIATTLTPTGDMPVPIAFGWHPYLEPPGSSRESWEITVPVTRHGLLDARGIPTGEEEPAGDLDGPLGDRAFDDLYPGVDPAAVFAVEGGGRRLTVEFDSGYPVAQVYTPEGGEFICFEPMTAPTNALVSGDGLRQVSPGEAFTATFSIGVATT